MAGGGLVGLRADRPLISTPGDLEGEVPFAERTDGQPAARVGGIGLGVARRTERHQAVEIEVRAALGAVDDVVDLEGAPAATGLAAPAGTPEDHPTDGRPFLTRRRRPAQGNGRVGSEGISTFPKKRPE
jgi:hypothetical protein